MNEEKKTLVETLNGWEIYNLHPGEYAVHRYEVYNPETKQSFRYFNLSVAKEHAKMISPVGKINEES